jgi:hypothetical protein
VQAFAGDAFAALTGGRLSTLIDRVFPRSTRPRAPGKYLRANAHVGRVVLRVH